MNNKPFQLDILECKRAFPRVKTAFLIHRNAERELSYYTYVTHIADVYYVNILVSFYAGEMDPKLAGRPNYQGKDRNTIMT